MIPARAGQHLEDRFGATFYRVPPSSADEFLALQRQAADVYRERALGWSLWQGRKVREQWVEFGPEFRERAALERATAALEGEHVLGRLAAFKVRSPSFPLAEERPRLDTDVDEAHDHGSLAVAPLAPVEDDEGDPVNSVIVAYSVTTSDLEQVLSVGDGARGFFRPDLPPIDPADMTAAMRRAQALARALADRLDAAVPEPFWITADQEVIHIRDERGMGTYRTIVDMGIEEAVALVLDDVQEELTQQLTIPWPHDPRRGCVFPEPGVAIRDGVLHFWYGDVLSFDPIPLSELEA